MSRSTLHDRVRPAAPYKYTKPQKALALAREIKRRLYDAGILTRKARPNFDWHWFLSSNRMSGNIQNTTPLGTGGVVQADTLSQAKAAIKKELGIKGKRLPAAVRIKQVDPNATESNSAPTGANGSVTG